MNILCMVPTHFMNIEDLEWPGRLWFSEDKNKYNHFDAVILDPSTTVRKLDLFHLPRLRLIITASTGRNHIDLEACNSQGVDVLSLLDDRDGLSEITASSEFTFLLILFVLRRMSRLSYTIYNRKWLRDEEALRGNELCGKTVGIVGMGRIGRNIYKWCYMFGANPLYLYDPPAGMAHTLEDVFQKSDIVVISCELNKQTIDMIGSDLVQSMKDGACIINTSRGEVVREKELVKALIARPDITYATDVLAGETSKTHYDSKLFDIPNCIITPHVAGLTIESNEKALRIVNKLLWRWYEQNGLDKSNS
jgi:D-3-phosphoglycerate dehydrogenase